MFKEILQEVVEGVDGALGAVLMGYDGIAVDQHESTSADYPTETVGMEYSVVLKEILKASELLQVGSAEEMAVRSEKMDAVFRMVNDEYFVLLTLNPGSNIGKGKFLLRLAVPRIRTQL